MNTNGSRLCALYLALPVVMMAVGPVSAQVAWPAESLDQAVNLTSIEGPGANDFYLDLSGAVWNPVTRRLWVVRNGPGGGNSKFWAIRENDQGGYEIDYKNGNRGEWTGFGDLEGITLADYNEDVVYLIIEGEDRIKEYDVSTYGTNVLRNDWYIGACVPAYDGSSGSEGIVFVPDAFLSAQGFVDASGNAYTSQGGMGGLMFVAHQNGGRLYAFDLNRTNGTFTFVGAYKTNYSESCDVAFDRSEGLLYIFHGADLNRVEVVTLGSMLVGGERQLHQVVMFDTIGAGNMEGFAVVSNEDCDQGHRRAFLTIDGGGASSLFMFSQFPCRLSATYAVDDDNDGIPNCDDRCSDTPAGQSVSAGGCACSQLDDDQDGVSNCTDQCPGTPAGQSVSAGGCACSQLDDDQDGVSNCTDQCPGTPAGQSVSAGGCACSQLDDDQDGVSNCTDQCPGTPAGQSVSAGGCACSQLDDDQDGVSNCTDQCPGTPAGQSVSAGGCACSQLDDDQDGVSNCADQCPGTPAGQSVNASGCACSQLDDDQDGVSNCLDRCPATARGALVKEDGCSEAQAFNYDGAGDNPLEVSTVAPSNVASNSDVSSNPHSEQTGIASEAGPAIPLLDSGGGSPGHTSNERPGEATDEPAEEPDASGAPFDDDADIIAPPSIGICGFGVHQASILTLVGLGMFRHGHGRPRRRPA